MVKKYIKRLQKSQGSFQDIFIEIISKIEIGDFSDLDIVKMQWNENRYRCRVGKFRILFHKNIAGKYIIDDIGSRWDIYK